MHSESPVSRRNPSTDVHIVLGPQLTFDQYQEFRKAYEGRAKTSKFIVDFTRTTYIDSSALGMLLVLREYVDNDRTRVELLHVGPDVLRILKMACFDQLFTVKA